jgi:hypothetical protein
MPIAELSIPQGWDEITAEWMTAALSGHFPGTTVIMSRSCCATTGPTAVPDYS